MVGLGLLKSTIYIGRSLISLIYASTRNLHQVVQGNWLHSTAVDCSVCVCICMRVCVCMAGNLVLLILST